jgi:hypothetical protein
VLDHESFVTTYPQFEVKLHTTARRSQNDTDLNSKPKQEDETSSHPELDTLDESWIPKGDIWSYEAKMKDDIKFEPSPLQALICPPWSPGYSLSEKEWGYFDIKQIELVAWKENPILELQIPENERQILVDVVTDHLDKGGFRDIVGEKGQGMIILLYGPPGCGKTLTAGK